MNHVTIEIESLPDYPTCHGHTASMLAGYFHKLLSRYACGADQCALLPSFTELSTVLHCSMADLQSALQLLREQGYDFFILGLDCPISIRYPHPGQSSSFHGLNFHK